MRKNQKGFTLVELLVVIAILAILATVAVVGYSSFIDSAHESNDTTLVAQMNNVLMLAGIEEVPDDFTSMIRYLEAENVKLDSYTPAVEGRQFYWVKSLNRIVYAESDSSHKVIFPKDYKDQEYKAGDWFVLDGSITFENYEIDNNGIVNISNAGQFAKLAYDYANGKAGNVTKIVLNDDIDLAGAQACFGEIKADFEFDGNSKTVYGLRASKNTTIGTGEYEGKGYGYALFGTIEEDITVNLHNVNFDGMVVGDISNLNNGSTALLAGKVSGTFNVSNVKLSNCNLTGGDKVGSIAGSVGEKGVIKAEHVSFEKVTVRGGVYTAKLFGALKETSNISIENVSGDGIIVECFEEWFEAFKANGNIKESFVYQNHTYWMLSSYVASTITNELAWQNIDKNSADKHEYNGTQYPIYTLPVSSFGTEQ